MGRLKDRGIAIEAVDILSVPSRDVEADVRFSRDVLGGHVICAGAAMGARVAEVAIGAAALPMTAHAFERPLARGAGNPEGRSAAWPWRWSARS